VSLWSACARWRLHRKFLSVKNRDYIGLTALHTELLQSHLDLRMIANALTEPGYCRVTGIQEVSRMARA
jgi:hypothetical protein